MKAYRKCVAIATVCAATGAASAQSADPAAIVADTTVHPYANERHVIGRALGGVAFGFNDVYGHGALLPPWVMVDGSYLFLNFGNVHTGPSLGAQVGFDAHSGAQWAVQPGWMALMRYNRAFAFTGRIDVPFLVTGGVVGRQMVSSAITNGMHSGVLAPLNNSLALAVGVELGVGVAYYLRAGLAVTGEVNGGVYFGDSTITYPYVGVGLGVLVDYELLP